VPATNQIPQVVWSYFSLLRVLRCFAWRTHRHALKAKIMVPEFLKLVKTETKLVTV